MDSLIITFDDIPVYGVAFEPKNKRVKAGRAGHIYIEPITKTIVRIEYTMTPQAARKVMNTRFSNIDVDGKSVTAYTQFCKFDGKWMLRRDTVVQFVANFEDKLENKIEYLDVQFYLLIIYVSRLQQQFYTHLILLR